MKIEFLCDEIQHAPAVTRWIFNEWVKHRVSDMTYEQLLGRIQNCHKDKFPIRLVALIDGKCVGTIALVENDLKGKSHTPWLAALYIDPDYRNQKIGMQLTERLKAVAKELGYKELYLRTETASDYYRKLGWEFVESYKDKDLTPDVFKTKL